MNQRQRELAFRRRLNKWKIRAHNSFDLLWQSRFMSRDAAYQYLQKLMGMDEDEAHIKNFNIDQCKELLKKLKILEVQIRKLYAEELEEYERTKQI